MSFLLAFALALIVSVVVSEYADRSVLSISVLFLAAGFLLRYFGGTDFSATDPNVFEVIEVAIFAVLFTDGMRIEISELRQRWLLPTRALVAGFPLTLALTALLARYIAGVSWPAALVVGAVLSPTDPLLAQAIVGRAEVPQRIRHLLNVESGFNDGLAAPFVILLLSAISPQKEGMGEVILQMLYGIGLGVALPWAVVTIMQRIPLHSSKRYLPLGPFALGVLLFAVAKITHANIFLAAFAGGISLASFGRSEYRDAFRDFGDLCAELLKLAALMMFGALLTVHMFAQLSWSAYLFAAAALIIPRSAALALSLYGTDFSRHEWFTVTWFGPKGFSSVIYALYILHSGAPQAMSLVRLVGLVIVYSIVLHSSTDVLIARWFTQQQSVVPAVPRGDTAPPDL
jgi:NhaP-type Na+/H+ or K+/H+ antiporter